MAKNRWSVELGQGLGDLELGVDREEILRRLQDLQIEFEAEEDDPYVYVPEMDVQLFFTEESPPRLVQVTVENDAARFGSETVIGRRLHEVTSWLRVQESETLWRRDADPEDSLPARDTPRRTGATDEELLDVGTLWILPLGLGLRMDQGEIAEIALRLPTDMPTRGLGPLTPAQLELSRKDDLRVYLASPGRGVPAAQRAYRFLVGAAFFAMIGYIVYQAADYQRRWQAAPQTIATVIVVSPDHPNAIPERFTISYLDQRGTEHQALLKLSDVYVPKKLGDTIDIQYLPESPDEPLVVGRSSDAAFIKYFPWAIATLAGYLVLLVGGAIVGRLAR